MTYVPPGTPPKEGVLASKLSLRALQRSLPDQHPVELPANGTPLTDHQRKQIMHFLDHPRQFSAEDVINFQYPPVSYHTDMLCCV